MVFNKASWTLLSLDNGAQKILHLAGYSSVTWNCTSVGMHSRSSAEISGTLKCEVWLLNQVHLCRVCFLPNILILLHYECSSWNHSLTVGLESFNLIFNAFEGFFQLIPQNSLIRKDSMMLLLNTTFCWMLTAKFK